MRLKKIAIVVSVLIMAGLIGSVVISTSLIGRGVWLRSDSVLAAEEPPPDLLMPLAMYQSPHTSLFGVELQRIWIDQGMLEAKEANAAWVRRNGLLWSDIESIEGIYNWSTVSQLEREFTRASERGFELILVIRSTPTWAQANPGSFCGPIRTNKLQSFANFMSAVVKRYSMPPYNVKYFEIWNEQDAERGIANFNPDPPYGCWGDETDPYYGGEYYTDVLTHVYPAVKTANPSAQVVVGGLLTACKQGVSSIECDHQEKYLEGMLYHRGARDGGNYFDILNFHSYDYYFNKEGKYGNGGWGSNLSEGPAFVKKLPFLQQTLDAYGFGNKEIIITETALLCGTTGEEPICQTQEYEKTKGYYAAQAFALSLAEGVRINIWYAMTSIWRGSALLDSNLNKLPAYYAFDFAEDTLNKSRFKRELWEYSNIKGLEFDRSDKTTWILWSILTDSDGYILPVSIMLPNEPSRVYTVFGDEFMIFTGTSLLVTAAPLYVEWDK